MKKDKIDKVLLPVPVEKQTEREEKVRTDFWSKFNNYAAQLPFAEEVAAAYYCALDPNTPHKVRGTLVAALAYFILPLDMVPDILAFIGFSDDIAVLTAAMTMVKNHINDEHREQARATLERAKEEGGR